MAACEDHAITCCHTGTVRREWHVDTRRRTRAGCWQDKQYDGRKGEGAVEWEHGQCRQYAFVFEEIESCATEAIA